MSEFTTSASLADFSGDSPGTTVGEQDAQDTETQFPLTVEACPAEFLLHGSPYRLIGVTTDRRAVYVVPNVDHNGLSPEGRRDKLSSAFELHSVPVSVFDIPDDDDSGTNLISPNGPVTIQREEFLESSEGWDEFITDGERPTTRSECIDAFGMFNWHDVSSYLDVLSNPSLTDFPEHFSHEGLSMHLAGVTTTGLAYYDTMDMPYFTVCTIIEDEVRFFYDRASHVSINGLSTNHLPYAQYLARIELEGDGWVDLTSLGKTYVKDYIESVNDLTSLVE